MVQAPALPAKAVNRLSTESRVLMKAILYHASIPRFVAARLLGKRFPARALPLRCVSLPEPEPLHGYERLRVRMSGICGSDLALLYGKNSPAISPFFSFPAVLGHEILAELGGVRVAVNPVLSCLERGLPDCPACARGEDHLCQNIAEGNLSSSLLGFCAELPGGWSQRILAHRERIHPIPEGVPDERAVLTEPLAVVVRGVKQGLAKDWPKDVLVIGAGTIGLLTVKALRVLGFAGPIHVVARRSRQVELAKALGASATHASTAEAQKAYGAKRYRGALGATAWRGGFDAVIEASGSPGGLQEASWAVREGGRVVLLGAPGQAWHDFSPYWFREVRLFGSYCYSWDDFAETVKMLPYAEGIEQLVGEKYPLEAWPEAIKAAATRKGSKVVFKP
ncbi:Alcohol dehydrogenase zinc-binding domain protein [Allomeiothermus silvanus DSM 9946]|uniref:Alcohol dehydrogenase zinc-binding domain protein n=2 Tax=Allomeiothermus silvanus TaxID=52022 RepID=D7BC18_ALLS1|nr:Alcohol dehydrogenase zinc-binding domain protein [Allomeiothermus silvanus DSM 9946]